MNFRGVLLAGVAAGLAMAACTTVRAQESPPTVEAEAESETNVTSYPPSFFAPYNASTARDMLNWIPGFSFDGGSGARGFAGTAGNVLIDGQRPPSRSDSLDSILGRIPASSVERIDIVRGGAGGIDMQGRNIVANVIRKKGDTTKGAVNANVTAFNDGGVYRRGALELQRQAGERTYDLSLVAEANDSVANNSRLRRNPDGYLIFRSQGAGNSHPRTYSGTGAVETPLGAGQLRLNIKLLRQHTQNDFTEKVYTPGGFTFEEFIDHNTQGEVGARYTRPLGKSVSLEAVAFQKLTTDVWADEYDTSDFNSLSTLKNRTGESIGNVKAIWKAGAKWTYEAGAEAAYNFVDQRQGFFLNGDGLDLAGSISTVDELREEVFVTGTWAARPTLSLETGLRYEYSTITAEGSAGNAESRLGYLKPRAVLSWTPSNHHQFLLRVEKTVDQLDFGSFAASASFSTGTFGVGNSTIRPQQTLQSYARYQYSFAKQGSMVVAYTHQALTDWVSQIVIFLPSGSGTSPFGVSVNVPHASRDIIDGSLSLPLDAIGFTGAVLSAGNQWRTSSLPDPITFIDRRIGGDRASVWNVSLTQTLNAAHVVWNVRLTGATRNRGYGSQQVNYNYDDIRAQASMVWTPRINTTVTVGSNYFTGGHNYNGFILFNGPRQLSPVVYSEDQRSHIRRQVFVVLRQAF